MKFIVPQQYIDDHLVSVQKHPTKDLFIYNYTQKCQFERAWDEVTMQCRGLILDGEGTIIARPFKKFFNLDEYLADESKQLPTDDFEVFDKLDGSLGILYYDSVVPQLATRGSFVSEQAIRGSKILTEKYNGYPFLLDYTYLFEIIYPENRIVVDYREKEDLFLLAVIERDSGKELSYLAMSMLLKDCNNPFPIVERFDGITDIAEIRNMVRDNSEGFVIRYPKTNFRLKLKYDEYVRLHRLVTGVNAKRIWEHLRDGQSLDELLDRVPDEFYSWVKKVQENLQWEYNLIETKAQEGFETIKDLPTRKDQAIAIKDSPVRGVIFKMLDKHSYAEVIWKMVRPEAEKPFKEDIDV